MRLEKNRQEIRFWRRLIEKWEATFHEPPPERMLEALEDAERRLNAAPWRTRAESASRRPVHQMKAMNNLPVAGAPSTEVREVGLQDGDYGIGRGLRPARLLQEAKSGCDGVSTPALKRVRAGGFLLRDRQQGPALHRRRRCAEGAQQPDEVLAMVRGSSRYAARSPDSCDRDGSEHLRRSLPVCAAQDSRTT